MWRPRLRRMGPGRSRRWRAQLTQTIFGVTLGAFQCQDGSVPGQLSPGHPRVPVHGTPPSAPESTRKASSCWGSRGVGSTRPPPCGFCRAAVFLSVSPWTHRALPHAMPLLGAVFLSVSPWTHRALPHAMPLLGEACATRNELCRQKNKKCIVLCFIRRFPRWHD